jgi:hypothetical protein
MNNDDIVVRLRRDFLLRIASEAAETIERLRQERDAQFEIAEQLRYRLERYERQERDQDRRRYEEQG